jgi:hypothetical protein
MFTFLGGYDGVDQSRMAGGRGEEAWNESKAI